MGKTTITFADYYRDAPVVFSTDSPNFAVLFNAENDVIRIRETWDPKVDPADFALRISEMRGGMDGNAWLINSHSHSPSPMYEAHPYGETVWEELLPYRDQYTGQGEVFNFTFPPYCMHKEIGIMLHQPPNERTGDKPPCEKNKPLRPSLEELPPELHQVILDKLSLYEILHVLPFVSAKLFNVVKNRRNWKELTFKEYFPTLRNLQLLVDKSYQTCSKLTIKDNNHEELLDPSWTNQQEFYNRLFWHPRWACLTHLHVEGQLLSFNAKLIRYGFKKGQFPALKVLKMFPKEGTCWNDLYDCSNLQQLKHLEVSIGSTYHEEFVSSVFWSQLSGLETLGVFALEEVWFQEIFPQWKNKDGSPKMADLLPKLRTLKIGTIAGGLTKREFARGLQCFSGMNIQRLFLCKPLPYGDPDDPLTIAGYWLFTNFSKVQYLCIQGDLQVNWRTAPKSSLRKLIHLRTPMYQPTENIPFKSMVNLEAVCLHISKLDNPVDDQKLFKGCCSIKSLQKLKKVKTMKMVGGSVLDGLRPEKGSSWSTHSLDLSRWYYPNVFSALAGAETADLKQVLQLAEYFPNLRRLALPRMNPVKPAGAEFVSKILKSFKNILQLEISCFQFMELGKFKKSFPGNLFEPLVPFFEDDQEELYHSLTGRGVFRATGGTGPGKECFVFDDDDFYGFGDSMADFYFRISRL